MVAKGLAGEKLASNQGGGQNGGARSSLPRAKEDPVFYRSLELGKKPQAKITSVL